MTKKKTPPAEPAPNLGDQIEEHAKLQFTRAEVATILKHGPGDWTPDQQTAYTRGRLKATALVRKAILRSAEHGGPQAQKQFTELAERLDKTDPTGGPWSIS